MTVTAEAPFTDAPDTDRPADAGGYMAKARGCKHYRSKYGTPAQCSDCPAARLMPVRAPSEVAVRQDVIDVKPSQVVTHIPRAKLDGAQLLASAYNGLGYFGVWPSEAALVTAALWTAQRHAVDKERMPVWQYSPHMFFTGSQGGCGKSKLAKLTLRLAPGPKLLLEPTKAALVAFIAKRATVGITELDILVGTGTRNRWVTAIANGAFDPEPTTSKMSGGKEVEIPLFGGMVLDGLDSVIHSTGVDLRTLMSRCIIVHVRKAPENYRAPRVDRQAREEFAWLQSQLALWMMQEVQDGIEDDVPGVPEGLGNRPASLWEPLFAVADRAGGTWPERAREACRTIEGSAGLPQDEAESRRHHSVFDAWAAKASAQAGDDDDLL